MSRRCRLLLAAKGKLFEEGGRAPKVTLHRVRLWVAERLRDGKRPFVFAVLPFWPHVVHRLVEVAYLEMVAYVSHSALLC